MCDCLFLAFSFLGKIRVRVKWRYSVDQEIWSWGGGKESNGLRIIYLFVFAELEFSVVTEFNFCCDLSFPPPSHCFPLISGFSGLAWECAEPTLEGSASAFMDMRLLAVLRWFRAKLRLSCNWFLLCLVLSIIHALVPQPTVQWGHYWAGDWILPGRIYKQVKLCLGLVVGTYLYFSTTNESYLDYEPFLLSFCEIFQTFCDSVHSKIIPQKV